MKMACISVNEPYPQAGSLTFQKLYEVPDEVKMNNGHLGYRVVNDRGKECVYDASRFKLPSFQEYCRYWDL